MANTNAGTMLVRINPSNNRESHSSCGVTITKSGGWYRVPTGVAKELQKERMSELNPDASPAVFEVMTDEEAAAREAAAAETHVEPPGTPDKPREVKVARKAPERESTR